MYMGGTYTGSVLLGVLGFWHLPALGQGEYN